jgi:hypothetical protein
MFKYVNFVRQNVRGGKKQDFTLPKLINPITPNDLLRRRAVIPLKIKIPSKNMRKKLTNVTIIHSVYYFGITLPSSGSVPSAF